MAGICLYRRSTAPAGGPLRFGSTAAARTHPTSTTSSSLRTRRCRASTEQPDRLSSICTLWVGKGVNQRKAVDRNWDPRRLIQCAFGDWWTDAGPNHNCGRKAGESLGSNQRPVPAHRAETGHSSPKEDQSRDNLCCSRSGCQLHLSRLGIQQGNQLLARRGRRNPTAAHNLPRAGRFPVQAHVSVTVRFSEEPSSDTPAKSPEVRA